MADVIKSAMFIAKSTTSLLSFLRVWAIYDGKKRVQYFFLGLWLCNVGGDSVTFLVIRGEQIHFIPIKVCIFGPLRRIYIAIAFFVRLLHDTLVFLAISYRLSSLSRVTEDLQRNFGVVEKGRNGIFAFFSGNNMPLFSRAFLKDGQIYYL